MFLPLFALNMSLKKYLFFSVLIHFFFAAILMFPQVSGSKIKSVIPKKWFLDASLVFSEESGKIIADKQSTIIPDSIPSIIKNPGSSSENYKNQPHESASALTQEEHKATIENPAEKYEASLREAFMSRVNTQFLLIKTKAFFKSLRTQLYSLLNDVLPEDSRPAFVGNSCRVTITYDENGKLAALSILPAKDSVLPQTKEFASALKEKIPWQSIPLPSDFALPYKGLHLTVSVSSSKFLIDIEPF